MGHETQGFDDLPEQLESEAAGKTTPERFKGALHASETHSGIDVRVDWDEDGKQYEIFFPQIDISSPIAEDLHIPDQIIQLGEDEAMARAVFRYADKLSDGMKDAYALYKAVENYIALQKNLLKIHGK